MSTENGNGHKLMTMNMNTLLVLSVAGIIGFTAFEVVSNGKHIAVLEEKLEVLAKQIEIIKDKK